MSAERVREDWRKRLRVELSPPAQRGRQPVLKTGRATGPRSLPSSNHVEPRPILSTQAVKEQLCPFARGEAHIGAVAQPARRVRGIVARGANDRLRPGA